VYFDAGRSRVFACAIDWPGWCRRAKSEEDALDALIEYAPRYAVVADRAGIRFGFDPTPVFDVVERLPAPAGTSFSAADFGALGDPCERDREPTSAAQAKRLAALVEAAWNVLDDVVAAAPEQLRKGPRGGGRDRDAVYAHVLGAEASYVRKLGLRHKEPDGDDTDAISTQRAETLAALRAARSADPAVGNGWPARYAARRIAWHVLDHAWEIEDKSE
jgi:hypothetical protein